jgi:glycosyltransferase involved in cell wall biosynthesis
MSRPRVLYVCHNHPRISPGGTEIYALELFEAVRDAGAFEPFLLARARPGAADLRAPLDDARIVRFDDDPHQSLFLTRDEEFDCFLGSARRLQSVLTDFGDYLRAVRPDVVHFQHTLHLGFELIAATRRTLPRAPIVYTLHEMVPICACDGHMVRPGSTELCDGASPRRCRQCLPERTAADFLLRRRFIQAHLEHVDRFVTPSRFLRQRYTEWGLAADRIVVEENGRRLGGRPSPGGRADGPVRFGFFGRLERPKGPDILLKAAQLLAREPDGPPIEVSFHGVGAEQWPELAREVAAFPRDGRCQARLAGGYRPSDQPALLADVDWVVVPSNWWENSPMVIQEAFASGRPVICGDVGGMAEKVTDGVNGLHFRIGQPASLAAVMTRAARSPELWARLAGAVPPVYSIDASAARLRAMYRELLDRTPGRQES